MATTTAQQRRDDARVVYDAFLAACPTRHVMEIVGGKWAGLIVEALRDGPLRHGELRTRIAGVSQKMLTQTLRSLERDGLAAVDRSHPDHDLLKPLPALGLVVLSRSDPGFVVLAGGSSGQQLLAPKLYGLVDEVEGLRGVVVELAAGEIHEYRLLTPEYAARSLTRWACRCLRTDDLG